MFCGKMYQKCSQRYNLIFKGVFQPYKKIEKYLYVCECSPGDNVRSVNRICTEVGVAVTRFGH